LIACAFLDRDWIKPLKMVPVSRAQPGKQNSAAIIDMETKEMAAQGWYKNKY
jgi:hypothetical protein